MVIVKDYFLRQGEKGNYVTLQLEGDLELVQSQNTGRFYATARRCNIYSTFDEQTASRMVGSQMPGKIVRVQCDAYDYEIPETGEIVTLSHNWDYVPDETPALKVKKTELPVGIVEYTRN